MLVLLVFRLFVVTTIVLPLVLLRAADAAFQVRYFAYGSNCYPNTMKLLRRIDCLDSCAAILPGYKLRFNIPGIPAVEPSWACVEPVVATSNNGNNDRNNNNDSDMDCWVHGVLYTLTLQDFARVSMSEGVPLAYQWKLVDVIPYQGDGDCAGQKAFVEATMSDDASSSSSTNNNKIKKAYTLVTNNPFLRLRDDIPPSRAYRDLLIRGAKSFQMDQSYIEKLEAIPIGLTLGEGFVAKNVLEAIEQQSSSSSSS
jgi:Gamma-glutamyl cyclotransferase, AIG2-like